VLQFLQHDGYVETARAFAEEIHAEKKALTIDPNTVVEGINIKDDEDANNRQRSWKYEAIQYDSKMLIRL
jgi:Ran-binding protein 9/10